MLLSTKAWELHLIGAKLRAARQEAGYGGQATCSSTNMRRGASSRHYDVNSGKEAVTKGLMTCVSLCAVLPLVVLAQETTNQISLREVRVNGAELHYVDQRSGVPVVFVHGGLEDYRAWQGQVEAFSERYRAIAYSRRYNYPNRRVVRESRYSPIVDADDLAALIKKLGLVPVHVVGHSYGACPNHRCCHCYARSRADRFSSLSS